MTSESENNKDHAPPLPVGKYTLVAIDVDTTGRRLIDEIVQLSAYTPEKQFSQYIMPYMNLNPAARQRHQVRVITVGFYRMLKCMQTFKVVKSKSEVAALKDFLEWIEDIKKSENSMGVILIHHEERKFVPYVILEAFKKYDMLERFLETVKSFANGYQLAKEKCSSVRNYSIRHLSRSLLNNNDDQRDKDQFEGSAKVRAKLAYQIVHHLAKNDLKQQQQQQQDIEQFHVIQNMANMIMKYTKPITDDVNELAIQNKIVERQNSFRPVFLQYFKTTLYHRVKAVRFRIILAENGYDYENLKAVWTEKRKEGLTEIIQGIASLKSNERNELIQILDCHFDPVKQPFKPVIRRSRRRRTRNRNNKENVIPKEGEEYQGDGEKTDMNGPNSSDMKIRQSSAARKMGKRSRNNFTRSRPLSSKL